MTIRIALPFWQGGREPVVIRLRILLSWLPVWLFLGASRIWPPWASILVGFSATAAVFLLTRRSTLIGILTTMGFSVVAVTSVIGIVNESEKAYLASGPVSDVIFATVFATSTAIRHPLAGGIAIELVPNVAGRLATNAGIYRVLTLGWALYYLLHAGASWFMLVELSVAQYIIWSRILLWPPLWLLFGASAAIVWRAATRRPPNSP